MKNAADRNFTVIIVWLGTYLLDNAVKLSVQCITAFAVLDLLFIKAIYEAFRRLLASF